MITVNDIVECRNCGVEPCIALVLGLSPLRLRIIMDLPSGNEHLAGMECGPNLSVRIEELRALTPSEQLEYLL